MHFDLHHVIASDTLNSLIAHLHYDIPFCKRFEPIMISNVKISLLIRVLRISHESRRFPKNRSNSGPTRSNLEKSGPTWRKLVHLGQLGKTRSNMEKLNQYNIPFQGIYFRYLFLNLTILLLSLSLGHDVALEGPRHDIRYWGTCICVMPHRSSHFGPKP